MAVMEMAVMEMAVMDGYSCVYMTYDTKGRSVTSNNSLVDLVNSF